MRRSSLKQRFALSDSFRFSKKDFWITLATCIGCLLILRFRPPCLILRYLRIPCPACGMTRAWLAALRLDFRAAFAFHPMFWSVPILYGYVLHACSVFRDPVVNWGFLGLILAGFLLNYILKLVEFFHLA